MTDTAIKIDKAIPLPSRNWGKFPYSTMEVGDSFFIPVYTVARVSQNFTSHRPKKFAARTVVENGVRGARVWRVS